MALDYCIKSYEFQDKSAKEIRANYEESEKYNDAKNLIYIKAAKLQEYASVQLVKLDDIAKEFYRCKGKHDSWDSIKTKLDQQVIIKSY